MQKRISKVIAITVTISVIIFGAIAFIVSYDTYTTEAEITLKSIANILAQNEYIPPENIYESLSKTLSYTTR